MRSYLPKVLHLVGGKPLLAHAIETAKSLSPEKIGVVIGHGAFQVSTLFSSEPVQFIQQAEQLGTGHAVLQAVPFFARGSRVLVLYGDVPLIRAATLKRFISVVPENALGILTAEFENPTGFGRIIRDEADKITAIVEEKDATAHQKIIKEINSGIILVSESFLSRALPELSASNQQGEYYLTDIVKIAVSENKPVCSFKVENHEEVLGVNDCVQLAQLERAYQKRRAIQLMEAGVTLRDPARFDSRGTLDVGTDVVIDINVVLEGHNVIGNGCTIDQNVIIKNTTLGEYVRVLPNSVIEDAVIGKGSVVGPFARIRPGTELAENVHVGNFVEIKKSFLGANTKANHLSYLGDATIGERVNIGAGTITCNYDGANKHVTTIEDDAFIGSNSSLIAPVKVGAGATLGAGTTLSEEAPAGALTITRALQKTISRWKRPEKKV